MVSARRDGVRTASSPPRAAIWLTSAAAFAVSAYGGYAAASWWRYGRAARAQSGRSNDELLDRFMPEYEVVERHQVAVDAPAEVTLAAAGALDLQQSPLIRAIFRARETVMGATHDDGPQRQGLLAQMQALGWGVLAEVPEREIIMGAVTQPWKPDVVFRAIPPEQFAAFKEPGFVKIAWTLRADPDGIGRSIFRTETRVFATDPVARRLFRRYWAFVSPGIRLIRILMLRPLKREAERRARG